MIGAPIDQVRTPKLLKASLARLGMPAEIAARNIEVDELDSFISRQRSCLEMAGLLVTMPHKQAIIPHLDALTRTAKLVGSVNAVKRLASGELVGAQFDGTGLVNALRAKGVPLSSSRVFLAGVGGAGMAIAHALAGQGCKSLGLGDTDSKRLQAATEILSAETNCRVSTMPCGDAAGFDLLINATPLGMKDVDHSPFTKSQVSTTTYIADIVADPAQTRLATMTRELQTTLISGRDMVNGQVDSIARWFMGDEIEQCEN